MSEAGCKLIFGRAEREGAHSNFGLAIGVEEDVGRLEVIVDDVTGRLVEVGQALHNLRCDHPRLLLWQHLHSSRP